jgi:outer membrane protein TolC
MKAGERHLGSQDWRISSSPFYVHEKPLSTSAFSPEQIDMLGGDVTIEKAFWKTGGRLSLSWTSQYTDQRMVDMVIPTLAGDIVFPAGPSTIYSNRVYVTYSQPLLQNYGGELDRLNYELSQYTIELTEIQAIENQEGFVLELADRFMDWALLSEQDRIARERLSLAEEQLQQTRRKWSANLVDRVDVLRAEDAVRMAQQGIVLIESQWRSKQAELAVLAQSEKLYQLAPEFDLYELEALPDPDEAVAGLREKSRVLSALTARHEQLSRLREGFSETARPQLQLSVGAGLQGGDEEFTGALEMDKPDVFVGLGFRHYLGSRTSRADIAKADLELRQLEEDLESIALDLEAGVRTLSILIGEMEEVLGLNEDRIESAEAKTKEELRLYNQGRGVLTFVIQSRDNEEQAKLDYAQNATSYHKLVLQYRALMDELLD